MRRGYEHGGIDVLSMQIRWRNIRIVTGIAIMCLFFIAGNASESPPPAIIKINGNEQTSGAGSNCWKVENETYSICLDAIGILTPTEPLLTRSPFTAHLRLPLQEAPEELGFSATRVTDDDELKGAVNNVRAWRFKGNVGNWNKLPSEREPNISLSLEPGLYVLDVGVEWKDIGSVSYGFLVQVYEPEAMVSPVKKIPGYNIFPVIMALLLLIIIRRNRRK